MSAPNSDPASPVTGNASPMAGNGRSVLHTRQFGPHMPAADTSLDNVSGNPQSEHGRAADETVYPKPGTEHDTTGRPVHFIPQRRAVMADGAEHEYDHEARGMDTQFNGGHLRAQAHVLAAQGDPLARNLMGDQRSPAAQKRGSTGYRAAIDRAGQQNTDND